MCQLSPPVEEPECRTVVRAVFAEYNAAGGLDGRPFEQVVCDNSASDPANVAQCHTQLSEDSNVIAFLANAGPGAIGPVLERAGMASVSPPGPRGRIAELAQLVPDLGLGWVRLRRVGRVHVEGPASPSPAACTRRASRSSRR